MCQLYIPSFYTLIFAVFIPISLLFVSTFIQNTLNLNAMIRNEKEFRSIDIFQNGKLREMVEHLPKQYGVVLLNQFALNMTLNWLCNTKEMNILHRILFVVLDDISEKELLLRYSSGNVFRLQANSLEKFFLPYDSTYMSFFLMRTNLIQALQAHGKEFWMLQADTFWRKSIFDEIQSTEGDILLDQQGYEGTAQSRKRMMNGANFLVPVRKSSRDLVADWLNWQKWVYITDPDIVKIFCLRGDYDCQFIPHKLVSGWEWIYSNQQNPPILIQMDGETGGNKERVLDQYGFWFLNSDLQCNSEKVQKAIDSVERGKVPLVHSTSKERQKVVLKIGEIINEIPVFGHFSSIYGGIASLYLQIF